MFRLWGIINYLFVLLICIFVYLFTSWCVLFLLYPSGFPTWTWSLINQWNQWTFYPFIVTLSVVEYLKQVSSCCHWRYRSRTHSLPREPLLYSLSKMNQTGRRVILVWGSRHGSCLGTQRVQILAEPHKRNRNAVQELGSASLVTEKASSEQTNGDAWRW